MWIVTGFAAAAAALLAAVCLVQPSQRTGVRGGWPELYDHTAMLCESAHARLGLRVRLPALGATAGVRLMHERRGLRLELAAHTETERAHEAAFRAACKRNGLAPTARTRARDRRRLLTATLRGQPHEAGPTIAAVIDATFAPGADSEIHIEWLA
jgi:hypothetical protein